MTRSSIKSYNKPHSRSKGKGWYERQVYMPSVDRKVAPKHRKAALKGSGSSGRYGSVTQAQAHKKTAGRSKRSQLMDRGKQDKRVGRKDYSTPSDIFDSVNISTMKAYGDANKYGYRVRDLDYKADSYVTPEEGTKIMRNSLGKYGYNEFKPSLILRTEELFENPEIRLAREYSVCIYVKGKPKASLSSIKDTMNADEVSKEKDGTTRIWWD